MDDANIKPAQGVPAKPMTKEMVADLLSIAPRTIEYWVKEGILPKPTLIGRRAYWHPKAIHTWLNSRLPMPDTPTAAVGITEPAQLRSPASPKGKRRGRPRSPLPTRITAKRPKSHKAK